MIALALPPSPTLPTLPTLSPDERSRLDVLEMVVEASFYVAACALQEIRDSELFRELGSWDEYCRLRWNKGARIMDYRIAAAKIIDQLAESTKVQLPEKEIQARALMTIPESDRVAVWEEAVAAYTIRVSADQITRTVERMAESMKLPESDPIKRQVFASGYKPIIGKMNAGQLKPARALAICDAIMDCDPDVRQDMLRLGANDPPFIRAMNRLYQARTHESYDEIVASGYIQVGEESEAVAVSAATSRVLRRYLDQKLQEHKIIAMLNGTQMLVLERACVEARIVDGQQMFVVVPGAGQLRLTVEWKV